MKAQLVRGVAVSSVLATVLTGLGCGDEEVLAPLGGGGGSAASVTTSTTSVVASGAGGLDEPDPPEPAIREVYQRDPFGNVGASHNLLWDGDFEWESAFADQYGWLEGFQYGLREPRAGAACRSGIKCAKLLAFSDLIGMALSTGSTDLFGSVWVKPTSATCDDVKVSLFTEGLEENGESVFLESAPLDASGWCFLSGVAPPRRDKTYLLITLPKAGATAIVDDAVVREATPEESQQVPRSFRAPTAQDAIDREEAREAIRKNRGPREGAPDPARRAFEKWGRGEGRTHLRPVARPGVAR